MSMLKSSMRLAAKLDSGNNKTAKFDLARAANVVSGDTWVSLGKAIASHDLESALGIMSANELGVSAQDPEGRTPLMLAVQSGNHELTKELVNRGASVETVDKEGRTAFDYALPGATTSTERDRRLQNPRLPSVNPAVLTTLTQALYACVRTRPVDKTPCQFMAEYLRDYNKSRYPDPAMMLPGKELVNRDDVEKPLGVSSNELNIALEFFRKLDVDNTGTLEVEESVLLVMRMANSIAGREVPDQTVLRAAKTLLGEAAHSPDGTIQRQELATGLDRICPVFRSFRSQLAGVSKSAEPARQCKPVEEVVDDLYADFDSNSDGILMPDEIALLTRRVADASGMDIADSQVIELFRLMMNHSMQDKDADGVLSKAEVKNALVMVMDFYRETIVKKYGSATHEGTALGW